MAPLHVLTTTPYVLDWLERTTAVSILHRFDQVCNVVNQNREVISIVAPSIGAGPFAIVVQEEQVGRWFEKDSVRIEKDYLVVNGVDVDISGAEIWNAKPNWRLLHENIGEWIEIVPQIEKMALQKRQTHHGIATTVAQQLHQLETKVIDAIVDENLVDFKTAVSQIAGFGGGLTPAGDDFLVGVVYGLYATCSENEVKVWADVVVETAVSRTTTLSGAWLRAATRGEAIAAWHELCQKLNMTGQPWNAPVLEILDIGHSSGADALTGFTAVIKQVLRRK